MPVSDAELSSLAGSHDILTIGAMGDEVRRSRHGTRTTFVRVADVDARRDPGQTELRVPATAGELRIGGTPASSAEAVAWVRAVAAPATGIPISGFSLADLEQLSAKEGVTLRAILEELRAAGMELVAEAAIDTLADVRRSIEEVNIAGLTLARLTVHQSRSSDPVPLLKTVAELQHAVAIIRAFAPLPRKLNPAAPTTGFDDVKKVALARIVADNVPSIQVDWSLYGPKLAQVALTVGADDVDGVSAEDDLSQGRRRAPVEEVRRNIRAAGLDPVERNGRFDLIAAGAGRVS